MERSDKNIEGPAGKGERKANVLIKSAAREQQESERENFAIAS